MAGKAKVVDGKLKPEEKKPLEAETTSPKAAGKPVPQPKQKSGRAKPGEAYTIYHTCHMQPIGEVAPFVERLLLCWSISFGRRGCSFG